MHLYHFIALFMLIKHSSLQDHVHMTMFKDLLDLRILIKDTLHTWHNIHLLQINMGIVYSPISVYKDCERWEMAIAKAQSL